MADPNGVDPDPIFVLMGNNVRQWLGWHADVRDGVPGLPRQTVRAQPESNQLTSKIIS